MTSTAEVSENLDVVEGVPVRSLTVPGRVGAAHVVVLPGLGAPGYLVPFANAVAQAGGSCTILDLPGFGTPGGLSSRPTVEGIGAVAAGWLRASPRGAPTVLLGHSTGAQAALRAALSLQDHQPPAALVMAGPTVAPPQRSLARLVVAAPAAYRHDSARELVVLPDFLRARIHLVAMLRSSIADRPEDNVRHLRVPLLLTAGRHDTFAPPSWLTMLATNAVAAQSVRVVRLAGSHNNPYTQPAALGQLVVAAGCLT